ncbi:hypothetical protein EV653_4202 [Kribbella pratensis]|uniref:Uncharacterized protein n=1 Tax=Kribbella pratensis TaxID=2512112 RepID=A0A4V3GFZ2_9ACTN|nr:hypothetical protein EV653_4202 [Kribbella pratensis]
MTAGTGTTGTGGTGTSVIDGTARTVIGGTGRTGTAAIGIDTASNENGRSLALRPFLVDQTASQTVVSTGSTPSASWSLASRTS